ncbi:hypothetical protein GCM10025867_07220 [Frondihabitans sucicola]|uniref:ABC transporter domain-containing protein n=1 Tax=Frondihabitans sucicola TaxID=1268041 RepID=A0ABM8GJB7_9MICO|nr:hypothetical protein GCM10025867_07220 [Frondihabitans sucicola]
MITNEAPEPAIRVRGIEKSFKDLPVLRGVDFDVAAGSIFALLGSNGAGKTTLVRILSTLLKADGGTASVHGFDVAARPGDVRESISLTGQFAAVDDVLTGRENLVLVAKLRHRKQPGVIADELLARFSLIEPGGRPVSTYSGGLRRRLDIAMSLIGDPPIIFLDEPTTGLDPAARIDVWQTIERLADNGTTVLLTTQYLDEAERLADRIAILHQGTIIQNGTLAELKKLLPEAQVEYVEKQPSSKTSSWLSSATAPRPPLGPVASLRRPGPRKKNSDDHLCPRRHDRADRALPPPHPAQPRHDHHHRDHSDRVDAPVRLRARRCDHHRLRRVVHRLHAPRHPAHHGRVGNRLHGLPTLPRPAGRDLRALPVDADRSIERAVGTRAHLLAANLSSVAIVTGVAVLLGFRTGASVGSWLAVAGILVLFTLALTWLAVIAGLSAKTVDGASAFSYPLIFLPFISSAFVPTASMPGPVAWFAENQPVTSVVDTLRGLFSQQPVGSDIWIALAWLAGILVVAYVVAVTLYRRRVG